MKTAEDDIKIPGPWTSHSRRVRVPSGIPRRHCVADILGHGACSFQMRPRDADRGIHVELEHAAIVLIEQGRLLVDGGLQALVLGHGQAAGLLPGLHTWSAVGAPGQVAVATVFVLPDEATGKLLDDGGLWQFFLNQAAKWVKPGALDLIFPLEEIRGLKLSSFVPGRACEGLLRVMGGHPYDEQFYRFLGSGPLRHRVGEPEGKVPESFVLNNPDGFPWANDAAIQEEKP